MIRKRLLSACLALALCLGLLPVTALAAGEDVPNVLYVGTTNIGTTSYNDNAAYWTSEDGGTTWNSQQTQPEGDSYIYYDGQGTLKLHNVTIQGQYDNSNVSGAGIYALCGTNQSVSLTIQLTGNNTITGDYGIYVEAQQGGTLGANASLSITGGGSLTVTGTASYGLYVKSGTGNASLTIENASVDATSSVSYFSYAGVCVGSSDSATAPALSLAVNGGSLTASGGSASGEGIKFYVGSSEATGATTSLTVSDNAIVRANGGISDDSSTDIQIGADSNESNGGIVFDGKNGTVYGDVELQKDLEIKSGETLTIPDGASLTIGNDATLINEGTVTNNGTLTNNGKIENSGTLTGTISGNAPPSIITPSLTDGTVGAAYSSVTLAASGNPTSWEITKGNLPAGLTISGSTISGTPTAAGDYTFTVTAKNDGGSDSKEFTLSIDEQGTIPVTGVSLNKSETTLTVGGTETLTVTITPDTATNKTVTWTSSNPNVATVDNGVVRAVAPGTATITVTTADGNYTAVCTVSVTPYIPPVPSYLIQLPEVEGGTVTADLAAARQGTEVALTVTPDEGFALASLTVTDFFGNQVDISRNSDGTYSFVMPASQVTVSAVFAPAQLPFTDVTEANWYYDEVYYVWANGLMQGTSATTFGPNVDTTRAMVVTILWRLEGEPASGYDMDYSDVAGGAWYAGAVRWATEHGIVNGSEGQFYPGGTVTREQLAAMLYRYAQYKGYDLTAGGDLSGFADAGAVSGWAETSLAWAVGQGLLQGSDSQVDPQGSAIRAQTAAILMRFCENMLE